MENAVFGGRMESLINATSERMQDADIRDGWIPIAMGSE
jgi:hypothetical protein